MTEENPRQAFGEGIPNQVVTLGLTREVKKDLNMKNNKAIGPDNIATEVWKS